MNRQYRAARLDGSKNGNMMREYQAAKIKTQHNKKIAAKQQHNWCKVMVASPWWTEGNGAISVHVSNKALCIQVTIQPSGFFHKVFPPCEAVTIGRWCVWSEILNPHHDCCCKTDFFFQLSVVSSVGWDGWLAKSTDEGVSALGHSKSPVRSGGKGEKLAINSVPVPCPLPHPC